MPVKFSVGAKELAQPAQSSDEAREEGLPTPTALRAPVPHDAKVAPWLEPLDEARPSDEPPSPEPMLWAW